MDGFRDEEAIRAGHHAAAFKGDASIFKACHFFFEELLRTFAEAFEVDRILFRTIGDADAAAEVDEGDGDAFFSLDLIRKIKHHADGAEKPRELELRGDDHTMDTNVEIPWSLDKSTQVMSWSLVMPYLASSGVPMIALPRASSGPGL